MAPRTELFRQAEVGMTLSVRTMAALLGSQVTTKVPSKPSYFASNVGRRLFFLFLISAIIPVLGLSFLTYDLVNTQVNQQNKQYLSQLSKSVGMTVYEKLLHYRDELKRLVTQLEQVESAELELDYLPESHYLHQLFTGVGIYDDHDNYIPISGKEKVDPELDSNAIQRIMAGDSVLKHYQQNGVSKTILAQHISMDLTNSSYIVAQLNTQTLWDLHETLPQNSQICVFSESAVPVFCTLDSTQIANIKNPLSFSDVHSGHFQWTQNNTEYAAHYWTIFLKGAFNAPNWRVLITTPVTTNNNISNTIFKHFLPIIFFSILLVAILSSIQIRKQLVPLDKLRRVTQEISEGNFLARVDLNSNDEFGELGKAFNSMATKLDRQFKSMEIMAEVDRVILSSIDAHYIIETVLTRVKDILRCDHVKLVLLPSSSKLITIDTPNKSAKHNNWIQTSKNEIKAHHVNAPTGIILVDEEHPAAKGLVNFVSDDTKTTLFFPLFIQDKFVGLIVSEFRIKASTNNDDTQHARELSDRLAVALSNASWEEKLYRQANFDEITRLPNRTLLLDRLDQAIRRAKHNRSQSVVLFLDIDQFKSINDSFSHSAGNLLLKEIGHRLSTRTDGIDTVARFGGDNFVIILSDISNNADSIPTIIEIAERLLTLIQLPFRLGEHEITVTASMGIAIYPTDSEKRDNLIKFAEAAMYHAKSQGKGSFQFYSEDINSRSIAQLVLENDLRHAFERNELVLHYQPQVSAATGELVGVEALIRWQHKELGLLSPARFLPMAKNSGQIVFLDIWVLEQACRQMRHWIENNIPVRRIAINVSAEQFRKNDLLSSLDRLLDQYQLSPNLIELEITEDTLMSDLENTTAILKSLNTRGVKLAIDDFGTGYSSLNYLAKFPLHYLKIDHSFVKDICHDKNMESIITATIALAHSLKLTVVAEGVETQQQLDFLSENNCDIIQGYFISRPIPVNELEQWLTSHKESITVSAKTPKRKNLAS